MLLLLGGFGTVSGSPPTPSEGAAGGGGYSSLDRYQWRKLKEAWAAQKSAKAAAERQKQEIEDLPKKKRKKKKAVATAVMALAAAATAAEALNTVGNPYGDVLARVDELRASLDAMTSKISAESARAVVSAAKALENAFFDQDEEEIYVLMISI